MALLLLFLTLPIVEIALFILVGGWIGLWPTLGIVIVSAVAGATLMRVQGMQTLDRLRARLEAGEDPSGPLFNGALLLVAGMLLLTPGFFTDALGLLLLLPPVRSALIRHAAGRLRGGAIVLVRQRPAPRPAAGAAETIEADYEVLDDVPPSERGASGWTRR